MDVLKIFEDATFQMEYLDHMNRVMKGIVELVIPVNGKFSYPIDKKRTAQTTDRMMASEENLDHFWSKFDQNWKRLAKKDIIDCMGDHTPKFKGQQLQRTKAWVEPTKEVKPKGQAKEQEPRKWTDTNDEKVPTTPKQKLKTKGVAQPAEVEEVVETPGAQVDKQPTFKVDKSAMKVSSTLFFTSGQSGHPGEIT